MYTIRLLSSSLASSSSSPVGNVVVTIDDGQVHCFFGRISTATISSWTARLRFTSPWRNICKGYGRRDTWARATSLFVYVCYCVDPQKNKGFISSYLTCLLWRFETKNILKTRQHYFSHTECHLSATHEYKSTLCATSQLRYKIMTHCVFKRYKVHTNRSHNLSYSKYDCMLCRLAKKGLTGRKRNWITWLNVIWSYPISWLKPSSPFSIWELHFLPLSQAQWPRKILTTTNHFQQPWLKNKLLQKIETKLCHVLCQNKAFVANQIVHRNQSIL